MKTIPDILLEILLAAIIFIFAAAVAYPKAEVEPIETDPPFVCQRVPCYRPPYLMHANGERVMSLKYITRRAE